MRVMKVAPQPKSPEKRNYRSDRMENPTAGVSMEITGPYSKLIALLKDDHRLKFSHIAVLVVLLSIREKQGSNTFPVKTKDIMRLAHVLSRATLYKVYSDLDEQGYICYQPSNDLKTGSKISIPDHHRYY
jgi:hypothetical protein